MGKIWVRKDKMQVFIQKNSDGTWNVGTGGFSRTLWIRALTPEKKFEAVREAILEEGLVFTEKMEKKIKKELNF
jgi:hypothetical protein